MSVITWDGKTLAADRQSCCGDTISTTRKIFKLDTGEVIALSGDLDIGMTMKRWYEDGRKREEWPDLNKDEKTFCRLIVATEDGVHYYERTPDPIPVLDLFMAWGCGREAALGALAMGASAERAVEIASRFILYCGNGCDSYRVRF